MGDIADMQIGDWETWWLEHDHRAPDHHADPFHKTCKYCGCKHLAWGETDFGWRLYNEQGEIHSCKEYQTKDREEHEPSTWQKNQIAYERDAVDWDDFDEILGNFGDWGDQ